MNDTVIQGPELLSMALSMLIVLGAVVGLGWLYSRLRFTGSAGGNIINIVASRGLGPKERVMLVEVGDKQLLVGMTATSIRTLHTFDTPVTPATATAQRPAADSSFAERLKSAVRGVAK